MIATEGYGKALYSRRKQHLENERTLREAITEAVDLLTDMEQARTVTELRVLANRVESVLADALIAAPPVLRKPMSILNELRERGELD